MQLAAVEIPAEVYGPFGALVILFLVAGALIQGIRTLWRDHLRADQDDRDQRDRALTLAELSQRANVEAAKAAKDMAAAWDARNKADAARRRSGDR